MGTTPRRYTPEEIRFITKKIPGRSFAEMTDLFNGHFGLRGKKKLTFEQMKSFMGNRHLRNGRDCRLRPGLIPHNKGKKGLCFPGCEKGWFRPGNRPQTWVPVGTERINVDGYVEVKVADPKVWKTKHAFIWEKAHGKIPRSHVIIFADGNKSNIRLNNLLMVSRGELLVMNKQGLISADKDLTKIGKSIAGIKLLIARRKRDMKTGKKPRRRKRNHEAYL
jgi:hypothetical protein